MGTADIEWGLIGAAVNFYSECGYEYVELPWFVDRKFSMVTAPSESCLMSVEGKGDLVGSSEQAFVEARSRGLLSRGRFLAVSPCFRRESARDGWHLDTFMKVELYSTERDDRSLLEDAREFFSGFGTVPSIVELSDGTFDLEIGGIEIGSYGSREHEGNWWTYGTGLALPRFSMAFRGYGI